MNKHIGSSFDEFLEEEKIFIEASVEALGRVYAWKLDCRQNHQKENNLKGRKPLVKTNGKAVKVARSAPKV